MRPHQRPLHAFEQALQLIVVSRHLHTNMLVIVGLAAIDVAVPVVDVFGNVLGVRMSGMTELAATDKDVVRVAALVTVPCMCIKVVE